MVNITTCEGWRYEFRTKNDENDDAHCYWMLMTMTNYNETKIHTVTLNLCLSFHQLNYLTSVVTWYSLHTVQTRYKTWWNFTEILISKLFLFILLNFQNFQFNAEPILQTLKSFPDEIYGLFSWQFFLSNPAIDWK